MSTRLWVLISVIAIPAAVRAAEAAFDPKTDPDTETCTTSNLSAIEASLPNILMRSIRTVNSEEGAAAADFLARHQNMPLQFAFLDEKRADRMHRMYYGNPNALMAFVRRENFFMVQHALLHKDGGDESVFIHDRKAQKNFATAVEMVFVHEVSHARASERLPNSPQLLENELLAFYRSFAFLLDALKSEPGFDGLDEVLNLELRVSGLADNCDRLDREIKLASGDKGKLVELRHERAQARQALLQLEKSYNERIPVKLGQIRLLAALAASNKDFEGMIAKLYPKLPHLDEDPAVPERLAQKEMDKLLASHKKLNALQASIGEARTPPPAVLVELIGKEIAFWKDPNAIAEARSYYRPPLAEIRAKMDQRRAAGGLKAFSVPQNSVRYISRDYFKSIGSTAGQ